MLLNRKPVAGALVAAALVLSVLALAATQRAHAITYNVTKTADSADGVCNSDCSLREAIMAANTTVGAVINVPAGTYTLALTGSESDTNPMPQWGDLDIEKSMTINGAGAGATIIDGGRISRVIQVFCFCAPPVVTISGVTIRNGSQAGPGGGISVGNGALVTINGSAISGNTGQDGGGINNAGTLTINNTAISANTATSGNGGGIQNALSTGTLNLTASTVSGNIAANSGGAIANRNNATITNVTISGNNAGANGGGIYNQSLTAGPSASLTNVTISGNFAGIGSAIRNDRAITLKNTIVANNSGGANCGGTVAVSSAGHNLDSGSSCRFGAAGDISNGNANLGGLAGNGGPTQTQALIPPSQAIDAGDNNGCPATDQRGFPRPQGAACDIGAYEYGAAAPTPTPTPSPIPTPSPTPVPTPTVAPGNRLWGDIDCSGAVDSVDSLKTLRYVTGLAITQTEWCPNPGTMPQVDGTPQLWGDIDCSGGINSVDALKILRRVTGLTITQNLPCPGLGAIVTVTP